MYLTLDNLEVLLAKKNSEVINDIYDIVLNELTSLPKDIDVNLFQTEESKKPLGTVAIYLSSLSELLHTTRDLIDNGFIESAGTLASAAWERSITLRVILTNPNKLSQVHMEHARAKNTPWKITEMLIKIVQKEHPDYPSHKIHTEVKLMNLQYMFLCTIKHGNPYTISHLNRPDKSSIAELCHLRPNDSDTDRDLKLYLKSLILDNALDALIDFFNTYGVGEKRKELKEFRKFVTKVILSVKLHFPSIFIADPNEFDAQFWQVLTDLDRKVKNI